MRDELALLRARQIDEDDLRRALGDFDGVWGAMLVHEREAVLRILVRELTFDGRTGEVEVNGVRFTLAIRRPGAPQPPRTKRASPRWGIRGARMLALAQVVERDPLCQSERDTFPLPVCCRGLKDACRCSTNPPTPPANAARATSTHYAARIFSAPRPPPA